MLALLVEAAYSQQKGGPLRQANLRLEVVRHVWRLAHELKVIASRQYEHGAKLIDELGRQIGGWIRSRDSAEGRLMKRLKNLCPQLVSFENLLRAYRTAKLGKRGRPGVAEFALNLGIRTPGSLQRDLQGWKLSPRRVPSLFTIYERKPRRYSRRAIS